MPSPHTLSHRKEGRVYNHCQRAKVALATIVSAPRVRPQRLPTRQGRVYNGCIRALFWGHDCPILCAIFAIYV